MAYIGRSTDKISNIEILDNITFDGSSSYSITKNSVAFVPNSAQSLLISIDGVVQATNFTVSSSTIDFGVAIPSTSSCDFFLHYGTGLITIPADGTVTSAKINYPLTTFSSTGIDDNATSTAITIDSSERVGLGRTPTNAPFEVQALALTGAPLFRFVGNASDGNYMRSSWYKSDNTTKLATLNVDGDVQMIFGTNSATPLVFNTSATERMRIESNGNVGLGKVHSDANNVSGIKFYATGLQYMYAPASTQIMRFYDSNTGTQAGSISITSSSTAYNTSSDYRLKENVSYDFDATSRLKQLKPARFNFTSEPNKTVDGFLAHEVSSIVPEAITGEKDATETKEKVVVNANGQVIAENIEQSDWEAGKIADQDGNTQYPTDSTWEATKVVPVYQGIDQAKLVPLLVKTIQELEARITQLENA